MPSNGLAAVFHHHRKVTVHRALIYTVITDRVVTVRPQLQDVYHQRVARLSALDVEGPCLRIAAKHASHAFLVRAAGIHSRGVHGVPRRDRQHRLIPRRKLPIEHCWRELMAPRYPMLQWHRTSCRERVLNRMIHVLRVGLCRASCDDTIFYRRIYVGSRAVVARGQQMNCGTAHRPLRQLVTCICTAQLIAILLQIHSQICRGPKEVCGHDPVSARIRFRPNLLPERKS